MIDSEICKIDETYLLDVVFYQQKDWKFRLFVEFSTLNVDFFTQALKAFHIEEIETYVSSSEGIKYFKNEKITKTHQKKPPKQKQTFCYHSSCLYTSIGTFK